MNDSIDDETNTHETTTDNLNTQTYALSKDQYPVIFWSEFYQENLSKTIGELPFEILYDQKILSKKFHPELGQKFHFLGIGGIGMSSLAQILHDHGSYVQGSDRYPSRGMAALLKDKYSFLIENDNDHLLFTDALWDNLLKNITYLVITSATRLDHPAILYCLKNNIPILHRSTILYEIIRPYKVIGVVGSHGKTTTTSLIGYLLDILDLDPLTIVGGIMQNYQNNLRLGSGPYAVVEIDESDENYLNCGALECLVVTSLTDEHAHIDEIAKRIKHLQSKVLNPAHVFINYDDENLKKAFPDINFSQKFGYSDDCAHKATLDEKREILLCENKTKGLILYIGLPFCLFSYHNGYHLIAALAVIQNVLECGITQLSKIGSFEESNVKTLGFQGVDRRLTLRGMINGIPFFDDYCNHPFTIQKMIVHTKKLISGHLWVVFEPHRYSRFNHNFNKFVHIFSENIHVLATDIYSANEHSEGEKTVHHFIEAISQNKNSEWCNTHVQNSLATAQLLLQKIQPGDGVLAVGSGNVSFFIQEVVTIIQGRGGFAFDKIKDSLN